MAKNPYLDLHAGDWMKDPKVSACLPATRGIWMDAICAMHESGTFALTGTVAQLARICRASESEMQSAIDDLCHTGAANVTQRNGNVTLTNRRRERAFSERDKARVRKQKQRGHADVTGGHATLHIPNTHIPIPPLPPKGESGGNGFHPKDEEAFSKFTKVWKEYPPLKRCSENIAFDAWMRLDPDMQTAKKMWLEIVRLKESGVWGEEFRYAKSFVEFIDSRAWEAGK
jgi:hypothetical protein